jgi:hypothetical protein
MQQLSWARLSAAFLLGQSLPPSWTTLAPALRYCCSSPAPTTQQSDGRAAEERLDHRHIINAAFADHAEKKAIDAPHRGSKCEGCSRHATDAGVEFACGRRRHRRQLRHSPRRPRGDQVLVAASSGSQRLLGRGCGCPCVRVLRAGCAARAVVLERSAEVVSVRCSMLRAHDRAVADAAAPLCLCKSTMMIRVGVHISCLHSQAKFCTRYFLECQIRTIAGHHVCSRLLYSYSRRI